LLVLAGCASPYANRLMWNLDEAGCARVHAVEVELVSVRDQTVLEDLAFPCEDGEAGVDVPLPPTGATQTGVLRGDMSQVIAKCTPTLARFGWQCDFAVP
jgi:hypothetical protein